MMLTGFIRWKCPEDEIDEKHIKSNHS